MKPARRRARCLTLGIVAALVVGIGAEEAPAAGEAGARKFKIDELIGYFDSIVFGSELDPKYASTVVAKWQKPTISVSLQLRVTEEHLGFVQRHLAALERNTRLKFSIAKDSAADIQILFVRTDEMAKIPVPAEYRAAAEKAAVNANCYFLSWKQPESRIVKAVIAANVDRDAAVLNSCLLEELTQSLGLPNDSDILRPSIFSDRDREFELQTQDKFLLHLLYHPRMKAGYSRDEALAAAREILAELAKAKRSN